MEERAIKISLEKAKEWYNSSDNSLKELALQAFNMNELEEPKLPKSWKELTQNDYSYEMAYVLKLDNLRRLLILRDAYRQKWIPDWDDRNPKYCISYTKNNPIIDIQFSSNRLFSFPTEEIAEQFLETFKYDLEQLKELL